MGSQNQSPTTSYNTDDSSNYQSIKSVTPLPYPLSDQTATLMPNYYSSSTNSGFRIYLTGGCVTDQMCVKDSTTHVLTCSCGLTTGGVMYFRPDFDSWHIVAPMPQARYRHMAAAVGWNLYIAGGRVVSTDALITSVDMFNTLTNVWTTIAQWPAATSDGAAFISGSRVFFVGGYDSFYNNIAATYMLDTTNTSLPLVPKSSMFVGRGDIAVASYGSKHYVMGGWDDSSVNGYYQWCLPYNIVESYDANTDTWTTEPSMLFQRGDMAAGVIGDHIFSIAGEVKAPDPDSTCSLSVPVRQVGRFDVSLQSWSLEESLSLDLFRFVGVSYNSSEVGNVIFLLGGQQTFNLAEMKYPLSDSNIRYIPASTVSHKHSTQPVSSGGIAGIVIAALIVVSALLFAALSYIAYARRGYYSKGGVEMSSMGIMSVDGDAEVDADADADTEIEAGKGKDNTSAVVHITI